jgi:hypothetical protein
MINTQVTFSQNYTAYRAESVPVIDGLGNENCWKTSSWAMINRAFDGKTLPDSSDFYGRYKITWTDAKLYVLMEITDDKLIDNRVNPTDNYWEDDCAEIFIDEDHLAQGHECGADAFNAFAYHIAAVARDKNNYANGSILSYNSPEAINHVIDLGADCNTNKALNMDDHVNMKITKDGNKYTWEMEFTIFDKNYNANSSSNTPVMLTANKTMGFAIAYCDDDTGKRDNMIGTVSNHNDYSGQYPFYRFTNDFGTVTLNDSVLSPTAIACLDDKPSHTCLWPNPVGNTLNIQTNSDASTIRIINMAGQTVLLQKTENNYSSIDVRHLSPGVYIETSELGNLHQLKFIKE